jgi:hypothetical protein
MINSHVFPVGFQQFGILLTCLIVAAAATPPLLAEPLRESGLGLNPAELRCEYRADPLGIDVSRPRLSWIVTSAERGQRQTGYQVLVAGSEAILKLDKGGTSRLHGARVRRRGRWTVPPATSLTKAQWVQEPL